mmetsp:Transcript_63834/g.116553  ORF Transcript_63834/g.116553 Transcript_63834/m.116553 type:complete len:585 (+) Transcript_63834:43-1797(+)
MALFEATSASSPSAKKRCSSSQLADLDGSPSKKQGIELTPKTSEQWQSPLHCFTRNASVATAEMASFATTGMAVEEPIPLDPIEAEHSELAGLDYKTQTVTLEIMASQSASVASEKVVDVLVSIKPPDAPDNGKPPPCDITCVIDTSGSMKREATIQDASGNTERHGLSLLDVAKHGVRTVINTLHAADRLCLVGFSSIATTVLPLTSMDNKGKELAQQKLDELVAYGGTDIWQGLSHGLDALHTDVEKGRLGHIMLLTDGVSQSADRIIPNLQQYCTKHERLPGTISTFGFGYNLDSRLLVQLAAEGSGSYSFIPDAGFVGTVFVNTVSNLMVTMAHEVYLGLEPGSDSGDELILKDCMLGDLPVTQQDGYTRVKLGTLQYGQTKDILLRMKTGGAEIPSFAASVHYEPAAGHDIVPACSPLAEATCGDPKEEMLQKMERHRCRANFAKALLRIFRDRLNVDSAKALLAPAIEKVRASPAREQESVKALLEDMCGQCTEALSRRDWFSKWGVHYLPSIMFAHRLQQCNNFKDPGVQCYGGKLFQEIRDHADDVFNNLPAPKPSIRRSHAAPVSMAAYNNCYGG